MSEEKKSYVIRDRRRFDEKGDPRPSNEAEEKPAAKAQAQQPSQARSAAGPSRPAAAPQQRQEDPRERAMKDAAAQAYAAESSGPPVDFASFVLSLATNAVVNLGGETRDGRIPGARINLKAAAQHIDILTMLEEKTRGNLHPEEAELLSQLLHDLRMQYVQIAQQVSRQSGPPPRRQ